MKKLILAVVVVACAMTISMGTSAQDAPKTHTMTGCLRAGTSFAFCGSVTVVKMIGMSLVAATAAWLVGVVMVTITSG